MHISLPESLIESARVQAEEGQYGNVSDYVRSLIRQDVRQREEDKLERMHLLRRLLVSFAPRRPARRRLQTSFGDEAPLCGSQPDRPGSSPPSEPQTRYRPPRSRNIARSPVHKGAVRGDSFVLKKPRWGLPT